METALKEKCLGRSGFARLGLWGGLLITVSLGLATSSLAPAAEPAAPQARMGMNLSGPADYNNEQAFVNVFRLSRPWISQKEGSPWGGGPALDLDEHGWVKRLETGCSAETILCTIAGGHYPSGRYTVLYDGEGKLTASNAGTVASQEPGRLALDVDAKKESIFLKITETNPQNYIRNIRVLMPGCETSYQTEPFQSGFLKRWQGMACLRFMDWMQTNNSKIREWSARPRLEDATFSEKGVPVEAMVDLCNRLKTDAWFCMPHQATDDYVRNFAQLVKDRLDPNLKVYIEYSNEVWNSMFQQCDYSIEKGKELGLGAPERPWEGGGMYYARRSVEIFKIWTEVFGARDRLVRVLAWQAGNTWWMENILLSDPAIAPQVDALGIAPYLGFSIPENGDGLTAAVVSGWSLDQLFAHLNSTVLPVSLKAMQDTQGVAKKYGFRMVAYEGGQHLVGVAGGENNEAMTHLFQTANADPRMGQLYDLYYKAWADTGGGLFCYFASVDSWSKWGSWGIFQYMDENPTLSPKFTATMRWARTWGQLGTGTNGAILIK
ncbi:MAG TPA: hypothetical protein PKH31_06255 [Candidatus Sumerlaeota bacterium]|nr:hypothetical protein [Candidatus Sumerlaeota bacterium]